VLGPADTRFRVTAFDRAGGPRVLEYDVFHAMEG
jgi:hypothetical protein